MQNLDKAFMVFDVSSLVVGYRALAEVTALEGLDLQIIDASPVSGSTFVLMLAGNVADLKQAEAKVEDVAETLDLDALADRERIEKPHPQLLPALFSLAQTDLQESLIVVQTDTVSGIVSTAQDLLQNHGLVVIDLKLGRGISGKGLGFFTGERDICAPAAEDTRTRLKTKIREGRVELIDAPTEKFRKFFNLSGLG